MVLALPNASSPRASYFVPLPWHFAGRTLDLQLIVTNGAAFGVMRLNIYYQLIEANEIYTDALITSNSYDVPTGTVSGPRRQGRYVVPDWITVGSDDRMLRLDLERDSAHANDGLAVDAYIHAVRLYETPY
jgi:hypothetical protein